MAKLINGKYFLEPDDQINGNNVTLKVDKDREGFSLIDLADAELFYWDAEREQEHKISYANDIPISDPNYGKIYYEL